LTVQAQPAPPVTNNASTESDIGTEVLLALGKPVRMATTLGHEVVLLTFLAPFAIMFPTADKFGGKSWLRELADAPMNVINA